MSKLSNILLVDDEDDVLNTIALLLSNNPHYNITKINNGREAIEYITIHKDELDLIISDINMNDINGLQLAKIAAGINPLIRIILMSGHVELIDQIKHYQLGVEIVLTKPFTIDELQTIIENPIDRKSCPITSMIPVKIESLINELRNPVDLYIRISDEKFIKIFYAKTNVDRERLEQFLSKDLYFLFATQEEALIVDLKLFIPVRISTLKTKRNLSFNVFYLNQDQDYKLLITNGLTLNDEMLSVVKDRNIKVLYIADKDQPLYLQYLDNILDEYMENKSNASEDKLSAASSLVMARTEETLLNPTAANLINLKKSQKHLIDFLKNDRNSIKDLLKLNEKNKGIHVHSTMVASLSYAILLEITAMRSDPNEKLKIRALDEFIFEKEEVKEIIFTGALLHDLGKMLLDISDSITTNTEAGFEKLKMLNHPEAAFVKLKDMGVVHPKALEIVIQHEEFSDGSGYPYKLKKINLSFFSQVVILVNTFDNLKRNQNLNNESALFEIKKTPERFNRHLIILLENILLSK